MPLVGQLLLLDFKEIVSNQIGNTSSNSHHHDDYNNHEAIHQAGTEGLFHAKLFILDFKLIAHAPNGSNIPF